MKKLGIIIFIAFSQFLAYGQSRKDSVQKAFTFIDSLLVAGTHEYKLVDFIYPANIQDIGIKMNNAIAQNKEWYLSYINKYYVPGKGLPYDPHMGITPSEYDQLKQIDSVQTILKILQTGQVEISKSSGIIRFKMLGENLILDFLSININSSQIFLGNDTILFEEEMNVNKSQRMGPWIGYSWSKEDVLNSDPEKMNEITSKVIHLIFARTILGQRFIRVKFQQVSKGNPLANDDLLFYLN